MIHKIIKYAKVINRNYGKMYLLVGPALDNKFYSSKLDIKILEILPKHKTSYHYHENIESVFIVLTGKLSAKIDGSIFLLEKDDYVAVKPHVKHQFINNSENASFVMEIMTPPYTKKYTIYDEYGGVYQDDWRTWR